MSAFVVQSPEDRACLSSDLVKEIPARSGRLMFQRLFRPPDCVVESTRLDARKHELKACIPLNRFALEKGHSEDTFVSIDCLGLAQPCREEPTLDEPTQGVDGRRVQAVAGQSPFGFRLVVAAETFETHADIKMNFALQ